MELTVCCKLIRLQENSLLAAESGVLCQGNQTDSLGLEPVSRALFESLQHHLQISSTILLFIIHFLSCSNKVTCYKFILVLGSMEFMLHILLSISLLVFGIHFQSYTSSKLTFYKLLLYQGVWILCSSKTCKSGKLQKTRKLPTLKDSFTHLRSSAYMIFCMSRDFWGMARQLFGHVHETGIKRSSDNMSPITQIAHFRHMLGLEKQIPCNCKYILIVIACEMRKIGDGQSWMADY